MQKQRQLQRMIDDIRGKNLSEQELVRLLNDERLLIVANVLMTLPALQPFSDPRGVVSALVEVATGRHAHKQVMGTVTIRNLAAATLRAVQHKEAQRGFDDVAATLSEQEREDLEWFIQNNLLTTK